MNKLKSTSILATLIIIATFTLDIMADNPTEDFFRRAAKYQEPKDIRFQFEQIKKIQDLDLELKSSGKFVIKEKNHVLWQILLPNKINVEISSDSITIEEYKNGKPNLTTYKLSSLNSNKKSAIGASVQDSLSWLNLDKNNLSEKFNIQLKTKDSYSLTPRIADKNLFREIILNFNNENDINLIILKEKTGDEIRISLKREKS